MNWPTGYLSATIYDEYGAKMYSSEYGLTYDEAVRKCDELVAQHGVNNVKNVMYYPQPISLSRPE